MAELSDGQEVSSEDTTATMKVTTDSSEGTLYAAARKGTAYQDGDGDLIKNGTGADWSGSIEGPAVGENIFNLTGLSDDIQNYHCGIVQETPPDGAVYEHDFNAALGGFTYTRSGAAWGFKHDGYVEQVAENVPVYFKCDHNGSVFTPHADYQGLSLSAGSTNTLIRNGAGLNDVRDYWTYLGLTLGSSFSIGDVYMVPITTGGSVASCDKGIDGTTYEGPWTWVGFVAEGTAAGFTVEISASRGTAHYAWVGGVPVLQSTEDGCRSWSYHCGGGLWAVALIIPTVTNIWKAVHFYPARKDAWQSGVLTYFYPGTLVDQGYPGSDTGPVLDATVTTAASKAVQDFSSMGLSDTQDFTVFMRVQFFHDDTVGSGARTIFSVNAQGATDQTDRLTMRLSGGKTTNYLVLEVKNGAGAIQYNSFPAAPILAGMPANIQLRYDSQGDITMRVDDQVLVREGMGEVLVGPRGALVLAQRSPVDTGGNPAEMAVRNVKVYDYLLTDQEMDDLNNAYP